MNLVLPSSTALLPWMAQPGYVVPGNPLTDEYLLPVSGGSDSAVLAIFLHHVAPHIRFRMIFTDTGAEEDETYRTLDKLENWLCRPIERIKGASLFDLIERYDGFLPSPRDRWCTKMLKLQPFQEWMAQFDGVQKWMFVGIRSDESERLAFTLPEVETVMPFVDVGITRAMVYRALAITIGIPRAYQTRSRSGCTVCPYQRTSEIVGLLQRNRVEFNRGAQYEKLAPADALRHAEGIPLWRDTSISENWHGLPLPDTELELHGRIKDARRADLFGTRLFIGGEFFMDGMYRPDEFVWHRRVVCFSTTLAGVKKQLDGRYQHLLGTGEVYEMDPDDVREKARFAIWYIELPSDTLDIAGPSAAESYTWKQGTSYRQIRHITQWAQRVLNAEHLRRQAATQPPLLSVQYEWAESAREALAEAVHPTGRLLLSQWYRPSEVVEEPTSEDEMLRRTPCPMCSI